MNTWHVYNKKQQPLVNTEFREAAFVCKVFIFSGESGIYISGNQCKVPYCTVKLCSCSFFPCIPSLCVCCAGCWCMRARVFLIFLCVFTYDVSCKNKNFNELYIAGKLPVSIGYC